MESSVHTLFLTKNSRTFQGLSRTHYPFFKDPFSVKKSLKSMSFLVLPQHEQFYPQGLFVFAPFPLELYFNYKVSIDIQGHTPTDCAKPCAIEASR